MILDFYFKFSNFVNMNLIKIRNNSLSCGWRNEIFRFTLRKPVNFRFPFIPELSRNSGLRNKFPDHSISKIEIFSGKMETLDKESFWWLWFGYTFNNTNSLWFQKCGQKNMHCDPNCCYILIGNEILERIGNDCKQIFQWNWVFVTNYDFLISISL